MLIMFDFAVLQVRYVKAAADQIVGFLPDGLNGTQIGTMLTGAATVRDSYVNAFTSISAARADRRLAIETLHDYCVDFAAQARSRYRKSPDIVERLERLPIQDKTFQETLARATAIIALWNTLPPVGTPPAAFKFGHATEDVSLADFSAIFDAAQVADSGLPAIDQVFQKQEGTLRLKLEELGDFAVAALEQGRSRYDEGTIERDLIETIPTEPAQQPPAQAVMTSAAQTAPGNVHLTYEADGGTSFDILQKTTGAPGDYSIIGDDLIDRELNVTGLAPGSYDFVVIAHNARGSGPSSEPSTVVVV